jgi:muramoyltetrapeptide carboxypeptidase
MNKPKALKPQDTIGIVAPASPAPLENLDKALDILEKMGFKTKVGTSCYEHRGYLAGSDETRASDINEMFRDPDIDAIICMRGGYGTPRILELLDYDMISKHPKIFMGYSDITAIHIALVQKSNLITFHGPMLTSDFTSPEFEKYTKGMMIKTLTQNVPLGEVKSPEYEPKVEVLVAQDAQGELIGGNLALIAATIGTPFEIDTKGKILMIEEVGEEPYRIDRMLTQLKLAGKLDDATGIVLGQFTDCNPQAPENSLSLEEVLEDIFSSLKKPVLKNVCFGHGRHKATIPLGVKASINAKRESLIIEESGVR